MSRAQLLLTALCLFVVASTGTRSADQTLIPAGSIWRYNDTANPGTSWKTAAFNDASWKMGAAQLGYGDGDESTTISYGSSATNRIISYYFRRTFTVTNPAAFSALSARFVRDDGAVIYLNGVEVVRSNMPTGTISSTTRATTAIGGTDESAWNQAAIDPARLVAGTNVIAVEVHQQSPSSTDVSFDFELRATEISAPVPTVTLVSPASGALSNSNTITFTANATAPDGLLNAMLYIAGPPQTAVFSGSSQIVDAEISADTPTVANGTDVNLNIDGATPHAHALMKFPTLIGGAGAVPTGAIINSATLQANCTNTGNTMRLYRLTQDWVADQATWNSRATGTAWGSPGADGAASNAGVALSGNCTSIGIISIDLTPFVQDWANGSANYGIVFVDSGTDGIDLSSSESGSSPVLTVVYKSTPNPAADPQSVSGTSATVSFTGTLPVGTYFWNVRTTDTAGRQTWAASDFQLTVDANSPDEPVLVSPADGATNVPLASPLRASVSDPGNGSLNVSAELRPAAAPEFTIIVVPDTQHYSESNPAIFTSQTQWIVNSKTERNIVFVTHEGDIVEHYNNEVEWQRANTSMSLLDGVVPYGMGPGNHDQPTGFYNTYFPFTRYENIVPWYGGHYQNLNDNNYQRFSASGINFVIVHLQFCPPAGAITWADSVYKSHPNHIGIMTTHGYLGDGAQRSVSGCTNTQYMWDGLAVPNPNLHFMLSGHVHTEARRTDTANGHPVYQMLADYQDRAPSGGEGWLRIMRFVPGDNKVYVQTYSPWLNQYETDADSQFSLDFPMSPGFTSLGSTSAISGSTVSFAPGSLAANTKYEWRVKVTNAAGKSRTGPTWTFTTASAGPVNQPPVADAQSVIVSEDDSTPVTLTASDFEGSPLSYSVVSGPAHGSLSGTPPSLTYQPAGNYSGSDSFTFRANDGSANSATATVSISVLPVNDAPSAVSNSYTVQSGATLTVSAPGVLGNDTDIDSAALTAELVTAPASGALTLAANGSFTYTPTAGFTGVDSFTYRARDAALASAPATVQITVQAAPPSGPVTIFSANFDAGQDSFTYADDTFGGTTQPGYASGTRITSGGFSGGALNVVLGGVNATLINGMSGGWRRTFTLAAPAAVTISFRYNLSQSPAYESDEQSAALLTVNGVLTGTASNQYVALITGNGDGGTTITTGWQLFQKSLGTLPAGTHTIVIGGYNTKKNAADETTTILVDDVLVVR